MSNLHETSEHEQHSIPLSAPLTPRDIVNKQISSYHYHVTEEDLDRMVVSDQLSPDQQKEVRAESDALSKPDTKTSYDVLDES